MLKTEQKQQILELRKKGYGYKSISGILRINRDSVRNLCKSYGLTGYGQPIESGDLDEPNNKRNCTNCGKEISVDDKRGRKPKFCCEECRINWWKNNSDKRNKSERAWYSFKCRNCGKEFKVYGNKSRKYCSIKCSTEYRFGSAT
jgi:predicted nucleic acid-binding Zn ribbon protein